MKKLIILASLLIVASNLIIAKQRSTRKNLKQSETTVVETSQPSIYADTICGDTVAKIITISGYEKPLRSRHETMLVTNNDSARTVTTLTLNITYSDMQGRTLHSRTVTSSLTVPATLNTPPRPQIVGRQHPLLLPRKPTRAHIITSNTLPRHHNSNFTHLHSLTPASSSVKWHSDGQCESDYMCGKLRWAGRGRRQTKSSRLFGRLLFVSSPSMYSV